MKKTIKRLTTWIGAIIISFCFVNVFIFVYFHQPGWISRTQAATSAIWNPDSFYSNGLEGFGMGKVDANGYINQFPIAEDPYILVMGSSHTQGKEVPIGERYTELVNRKITEEPKEYIYNIGTDGHYLPDLFKHFSAAVREFPNSKGVVLEVFNTDCNIETLENCLDQIPYNKGEDGSVIVQNQSGKQKLGILVKENMPLLNLLQQKQFADFKIDFSGAFGIHQPEPEAQTKEEVGDISRYKETLNQIFTMMKEAYQGEIFILYHPIVKIRGDKMEVTYDDTYQYFQQICEKQDIQIIDTGEAFQKNYEKEYGVPYGFCNTSIGEGHLNRTGHRILAKELYNALSQANLISCEDK